jgi:TRAP-type C4-dicarboxylate transport system permease small subunit
VGIKRSVLFIGKNSDLIISGICITILVLLTTTGVFMRYAVGKPFTWLEEIQLILFVWVVFFGGSAAFRFGGHIAIEVVVELFPRKAQKMFDAVVSVIIFCTLAYIMYLLLGRGFALIKTGRVTNILQIPLSWNYFGVAAACLFMLVNFTVSKIKKIRTPALEKEEVTP